MGLGLGTLGRKRSSRTVQGPLKEGDCPCTLPDKRGRSLNRANGDVLDVLDGLGVLSA